MRFCFGFFLQLFSIQDYLECVGRLQDHADVLEDVRKELAIAKHAGSNMEELQTQIEECQVRNQQLKSICDLCYK